MDDSYSSETVSSDSEKKYWAFVSYSSKDSKWGKWLHRRLENYPIPKEFQGTELFDGAVLGKDLKPCFRDRDELSGSADLGPAILKALNQSRYLIVLCSKNSAKSEWVNKEIEDFKNIGGEKKILALILDGEPNASSNPNFPDSEECFPPALRYPSEPLAGDMRKEGDGKERGFLKVLSGIAQLDFDVLYRRHERAERKKRLVLGGVAASIILMLTGLSIYAFQQKNFALVEQKRAEQARANAEASELREREAKEQSLALLKTVRSSLNFMNFDLRDVMNKYVSVRERSTVIEQVDSLLQALKELPNDNSENEEPDTQDLRQRLVGLQNKADLILDTSPNDPEALVVYDESFEIAKKLVALNPHKAEFKKDLAFTHDRQGQLYLKLGETDKALAHFEETLKLIEEVVNAVPENVRFQRDLRASHTNLGDLRFHLGETDKAQAHYLEGMKLSQRQFNLNPDSEELVRDLSNSHEKLGKVRLRLGQTTEALSHYEECMKLRERIVQLDPGNTQHQRDLSISHGRLGDQRLQLGETTKAFVHFNRGIALMERLVKLDPENWQYHYDLLVFHERLGDHLLAVGQTTKALVHFEERMRLIQMLVELDPNNAKFERELWASHRELSSLYAHEDISDYAKAKEELKAAIILLKRSKENGTLAPDDEILIFTLSFEIVKMAAME